MTHDCHWLAEGHPRRSKWRVVFSCLGVPDDSVASRIIVINSISPTDIDADLADVLARIGKRRTRWRMGKKYNSNALTKRYATAASAGGRPSSSSGPTLSGGGGGGGGVGVAAGDATAGGARERSVVDKLAALRRETPRSKTPLSPSAGLNDHSALRLAALSDPAFGSALRAAGYDATGTTTSAVVPKPRVLRGLGHAAPPSWQLSPDGATPPLRRRRRLVPAAVQRDAVLEVDDGDERLAFGNCATSEHTHPYPDEHHHEHAYGIASGVERQASRGPKQGLADACLYAVASELPLYADCAVHFLPLHLKSRLLARLPLNRWLLGCRLLFPRQSRRHAFDADTAGAAGADEVDEHQADDILAFDEELELEEPVERLRIGCLRQFYPDHSDPQRQHLQLQYTSGGQDAIDRLWRDSLSRFDTVRQLSLDLSASAYALQLGVVAGWLPQGIRALALIFHAASHHNTTQAGAAGRNDGRIDGQREALVQNALRQLSKRLVCLRELVLIIHPPEREAETGDVPRRPVPASVSASVSASASTMMSGSTSATTSVLAPHGDTAGWRTPLSPDAAPGDELKLAFMGLEGWSTTWASVERLRIYAPALHASAHAHAKVARDDDDDGAAQSDAADIERRVNQHRRKHGRYRPLHVSLHRYRAGQ